MRLIAMKAALAVSAVLLGVIMVAGVAGRAEAASQAVEVKGFVFQPAALNVAVGDTVTWTNNDGVAHTATSDSVGVFDVPLSSGGGGSFTFASAGSFPYHCEIHPGMKGTIVVSAAATSAGTPVAPAAGTGLEASGGSTNYPVTLAAALGLVALAGAAGVALARSRR